MKVNIFKIPNENIESLKQKIESLAMVKKYENINLSSWECSFYLSENPEINDISWVQDYSGIVDDIEQVRNIVYFAIYLCKKGENCFALTYGKSHFYVRNLCDVDFGLEMAKRIANKNDVKQKATKRFSGKKKKGIESFVKNTRLDNESGESVDYISAGIISSKRDYFGERSKFGSSVIISREDLTIRDLPKVLDEIIATLAGEVLFDLPRTSIIKDESRVNQYNSELLKQINTDISIIETEDSSYSLIGTDFVFQANEKYIFIFDTYKRSTEFSDLSHKELKKFIDDNSIRTESIFDIKVQIRNENDKTYRRFLYEMIEFMVPRENVILECGKWKEFNEEYLVQINSSVDSIDLENTESQFLEIKLSEPDFNKSDEVAVAGYEKADTDFSKIKIGSSYKVEAWDLQKDDTVYAVKFGSAQKLVYVCNQAMATLEIIRNNANLKKLDNYPRKYCLWFGFTREVPNNLSEVKSIILKQNIDMFARKCREIGIEPVVKFSKKIINKKNEKK